MKRIAIRAHLIGGTALLFGAMVSAAFAQSAERVTVVMDPNAAQTNRAWATGGSFDLDPVFQRLIRKRFRDGRV